MPMFPAYTRPTRGPRFGAHTERSHEVRVRDGLSKDDIQLLLETVDSMWEPEEAHGINGDVYRRTAYIRRGEHLAFAVATLQESQRVSGSQTKEQPSHHVEEGMVSPTLQESKAFPYCSS